MKIKKLLALLLAVVMVTAFVAACADDPAPADPGPQDPVATPEPGTPDAPPPPPDDSGVQTRANTFIVGYGASATQEFLAGWGNSAYDITIRDLLFGDIGTVASSPESEFYVNPTVVVDFSRVEEANGDVTYTFTIHEDLLWSDGTQITARDFVAHALWTRSPQLLSLGASFTSYAELVGMADYQGRLVYSEEPEDWGDDQEEPDDWDEEEQGEWAPTPYEPTLIGWEQDNEYFEGVKLLGDFEFSIRIDGEALPYFFELVWAAAAPIPLHVWAPGVDVISNENGSRFDTDIMDHAQRVSETERFAPSVSSGPYTFVSFENTIVTLQRNPLFKGDSQGRVPTIEFIQQIEVSTELDVDQLFAGDVDLLPQMIEGGKINRVIAEQGFITHEWLRDGYGILNIVSNWGPTADRNVRWAIAHVLDRQAVLDQVLEGFGSLIDTEVSEAQWMFQARRAEVIDAIRPIALNIEAAHDFLDQTEWVFEADGSTPFDRDLADAEGTYIRHNAAGDRLIIRNGAANPQVGDVIFIETVGNAAMAGIEFTSEFLEWAMVLDHLYYAAELPEEERLFSTFSMGTGLGVPFDPYWSWHSDQYLTWMNPSFNDPVLDGYIEAMRGTTPGDYASYLEAWFDYVVRWNYMLPALPLYANMSVELANERVQGLSAITPFANWAHPNVITQLSLAG